MSLNETPQSIGIIVGLDLIGDALLKLPFLRALRSAFPGAKVHWITAQGPTFYSRAELRAMTAHLIDEIHEKPVWLASKQTDAPHFDLLIDTRGRWRMARSARETVPHGTFIAPAFRFLFSDLRPPFWVRRPAHMVERLLQLVELASGHHPSSHGSLPIAPETLAKARLILPAGRTYVGFAPGAGREAKIWPRRRFEQVAQAQATKGRVPVFLLGPQELGWYDSLRLIVPDAVFPLQNLDVWETPAPTLEQTLAIASLLDVAVANDSGTSHMLAAVDCPLVSLFGPTSATKLAPHVSRRRVLRAQDAGPGSAMTNILWPTVNAAIEEILGG